MQQLLHLLLVDADLEAALVASAGGRCVLPIIAAPDTCRIGAVIRQWAHARDVWVQPVGQWLGRVSPQGAVDWLVVMQATKECARRVGSELTWVNLAALADAPWHVDYQRWAIARLLAGDGGLSVPGPFGNPTWLQQVSDWIREALDEPRGASFDVTPHRLSSHDVVLECSTDRGRWFFKGLSCRRAPEAQLTAVMSGLMPASFATTLALEPRADGSAWWLMDACPGVPMTERLTVEDGVRIVEACATVQRTIARELQRGRHVPAPVLDLSALSAWSVRAVRGAAGGSPPETRRAIEVACDEVASVGVYSWVAADLDPSNVIVDGHAVRFIDLDDALLAPAPLALATFARRLERAVRDRDWATAWPLQLVHAYERAWHPPLDLRRHWPAIDLVSDCLECWLAWQRMESKIASGEVHGVREVAQPALQRRLLRAVTRFRSAVSAT